MNAQLYDLLKDLSVSHIRNSTKIRVIIGKDEFKVKNVSELVEKIQGNFNKLNSNVHLNAYKNMNGYYDNPDIFQNKFEEELLETAVSLLENKTKKQNENAKNMNSTFDSFSRPVTELPKIGFNEIDRKILRNIRYCKEDDSIYVKNGDIVRLIGRLSVVQRDPSVNGLCFEIQKALGNAFNGGNPMPLDAYISLCVDAINECKKKCSEYLISELDKNTPWEDIEMSLDEEHYFIPSKYCSNENKNAVEFACDEYAISHFWTMAPGSIFSARLVELRAKYSNLELDKPNGDGTYKTTVFNNFFWNVVKSGEYLTESRYLKLILTEFISTIKDEEQFELKEMPKTYTDGDIPALFKYSDERIANYLKHNPMYTKLEECTNIMLLKSWMNEDEYRLAMAWAYAAIHPETVTSNIALLLWTGGGTGKSSFVAMIKEAIKIACGAKEEDFYFEIKGNRFDEDQRNWTPDGEIGLTKAALVNVDEATTKTIELYKDFSGSAAGNKLATRRNYENTIVTEIKGKFIFTTNKGLQLTNDDGSLLRRIAVIKHNEINNTIGQKDIKSNDEIVKEYKKQIFVLLSEGKKALKEIKDLGYDSVDEYAMSNENVTNNLKESNSTSINLILYETMWKVLEEQYKTYMIRLPNGHDEFRLQGQTLKELYRNACIVNGEEPTWYSAFRNFIKEHPQYFEEANSSKAATRFIRLELNDDGSGDYVQENKKTSNNIYHLHRLVTT